MSARSLAVVSLATACACAAHAQSSYPIRPVRLIVPFAPGGGTDIVARIVAQKAGELLKQTVVVDNRGGAGGLIGTEMAVRAAPDGYTLGVVTASLPISAATSRLSYDPVRDFTLISMLGATGYLITVHPSLPVKTTKDLIAYAKANPGKVTYALPAPAAPRTSRVSSSICSPACARRTCRTRARGPRSPISSRDRSA